MPLLQVRDFPQDLYEALARLAERENRSITQQTIYMLKNNIENYDVIDVRKTQSEENRKELFEKIRQIQLRFPKNENFLDTAALVREDRDR